MTTSADEDASAAGDSFGCVADALRAGNAALDYLNDEIAAGRVDGSGCGDPLIALAQMQAKLTAAHAGALRRFGAADAHDADGYGSSSAWLAARAGQPRKAARAAVRQMHQPGQHPLLAPALAGGDVTDSLAFAVADWTRPLPPALRTETGRILLEAAACGASADDLQVIAGLAIERWRQQQPGPDDPDGKFEDRSLRLGVTFGGAAVLRGNLTPSAPLPSARSWSPSGKGQARKITGPRTSASTTHPRRPASSCPAPASRPAGQAAAPRPSPTSRCPGCATSRARPAGRTPGSVPALARTATSPARTPRPRPATRRPSRS